MNDKTNSVNGIIKALGLVFGDIGTSPIYTMTVVFLFLPHITDNILGVLSLIIWTLISLVTIKFAWLAMNLSIRGEGGNIVLKEILQPLLKTKWSVRFVSILAIVSVALLIGDGVITPAISIMSAVEGSLLIPGLEGLSGTTLVLCSMFIAVMLFSVQRKGTEKVAGAFGPIMSLWFVALAVSGLLSIAEAPQMLMAFNPYYAVNFLLTNGFAGFIVLSEVILCATGGEALYADMGHLGSKPIRQAWAGVFVALILNYIGQGAYLLNHPQAKNILFEMIFDQAKTLYIPFLILSILATIIASQAMISGTFSMVYQGITTRLMPMFKVDYTSVERKSQIYISSVNWFLLIAVLFIMLEFKESSRLAAAYGLAVTGTMFLTGILMTWIFYLKKKKGLSFIALIITGIDLTYLTATFYKIPHGGYWSLILSTIPLAMILFYTEGQKKLYRAMDFMSLEEFLHKFNNVYATTERLKGTALFLIKDVKDMPFYVTQTMFFHGIMYEDTVFVSIIKRDDPFGITGFFKENLTRGLRVFEIQMGYMEVIDVEDILKGAGIEERVVFYGLEDIASRNIVWKIFALIKRITPPFIQFYKFPSRKLHGVFTKVSL